MGFSFEFKRRKGGLFLLLYKYPFSSSEKGLEIFHRKIRKKSRTWVGFLVAENFRVFENFEFEKKILEEHSASFPVCRRTVENLLEFLGKGFNGES